jgi:hypothetical protein
MGTESTPIQRGVTAELEFIDDGPIDESVWPDRKNKGLITNGDVEVVGAEKTPWTTLARDPTAGDASIELSTQLTNWNAGDTIVVPGLESYSSTSLDHEDEERVISSIDGTTVTLDAALDHDHVPPRSDLDTYALNLTRNAKFFSESSDVSRYGHFMLMSPGATVKYLELVNVGRTDKGRDATEPLWGRGEADPSSPPNPRARYAIHSHRTGPTNEAHVVVGCSVRDNPGWGIVNHDSNMIATDNVTYRVKGAGIVAEKGTEVGEFKRNFTLRSTGSGEQTESRKGWSNGFANSFEDPPHNIDDFGHSGHGFWMQSPLVAVEDNVMAGHRHTPITWWCRALYEQQLGSGEALDGKHDMFPLVEKNSLTDFEETYARTGDEDPPVGGGWHTSDSSKVFTDSLPLRSFRGNVAFGCGGGFDISRVAFRNQQSKIHRNVHTGNTAYNIGKLYLEDGSTHGQQNFTSSGNVGLDHRYVGNLEARNYRLVGSGDGIGVYRNHAYLDDFHVTDSVIENWHTGIVPPDYGGTANPCEVVNNEFDDNDVDVRIDGQMGGNNGGPLVLEDNAYSGTTALHWEEIATDSMIPERFVGDHSRVRFEGRTVYHGWSNPEFVIVQDGDTDRLDRMMNHGNGDRWQELLNGDDPREVLPGTTHQELYDQYGITFYGGIQDPDQAGFETPDDFAGSGGPYDSTPFLGPAEKTMPTDEIWIDATQMSLSGDYQIVQYGDGVENEAPIRLANDQTVVQLNRDDDRSWDLPVTDTEGVASYQVSVDTTGTYQVYVRCQQGESNGGVGGADENSQFYVRMDGGPWKRYTKPSGLAPQSDLVWPRTPWAVVDFELDSTGTHTIDIAGKGSGMRLDWVLVKHETVAANPFGDGKPHTTSDATAPTAPSNLSASNVSRSSVDLSWDAASDGGTGVDHYNVYVDGSKTSETADTSATVDGLQSDTTYDFHVTAVDGTGNESGESNTVSATTTSGVVGETGTVTTGQPDSDTWHQVSLTNSYTDPVVVIKPVSSEGWQSAHVRVRNVTQDSFEFRIEEWRYRTGYHTTETLPYLVVEAGQHTLSDGTVLEAGTADVNHWWQDVSFSGSFGSDPVVFSQCASFNGPHPVVTRQRNVTTDGFSVQLQEEEETGGWHTSERVDYVAIEPGGSSYTAGRTPASVTHDWYRIDFSSSYSSPPVFLAQMQTTNGWNPANVRYDDLTEDGVSVRVYEDRSADDELWHVGEEIGYFLMGTEGDIQ